MQRVNGSSGRVYYAYHRTKQCGETDPRGLDDNWSCCISHDGKVYYVRTPAGQSMLGTSATGKGIPACTDSRDM